MILFVCEGNVCRSPVAEAALRSHLAGLVNPPLIGSAGTRALVGASADAGTVAVAAKAGIDLSGHRARQLDRELAASATVLLTASRRIRSDVVSLHPPAIQYVFTLRQLARILDGFDPPAAVPDAEQRLADVRAYAVQHRGLRAVADPSADDVVDPYRRASKVHEESIAQILPAVAVLARALGGRPTG